MTRSSEGVGVKAIYYCLGKRIQKSKRRRIGLGPDDSLERLQGGDSGRDLRRPRIGGADRDGTRHVRTDRDAAHGRSVGPRRARPRGSIPI